MKESFPWLPYTVVGEGLGIVNGREPTQTIRREGQGKAGITRPRCAESGFARSKARKIRSLPSGRSVAGRPCAGSTSGCLVGRCVGFGRPFEQVVNLLVGGLREIAIPEADRVEWLWRHGAKDIIGFLLELGAGLGGADGSGHDDARRAPACAGQLRRPAWLTRWPGRRRSGSPCGPGRRAAAGRRDRPARAAPVPAARRRRRAR